MNFELVLKNASDVGQIELELKLAIAIHKVVVFQLTQLNEFTAAMNCKA